MSHILRHSSERTYVQLGQTKGAETVSTSLYISILSTLSPADDGAA